MTEKAEIVVAGGGPGGICAALAAARLGRKTALVTDRPVLGGNSSSEIRVWTRGATGGGNIYSEEMGIWGELKLRNLYLNQEGNPVFWDDVLLEQVLEEKNLVLYLNTHITGLETEQVGSLRAVTGYQMGSEKEIRFEGRFFIDATGDGSLGAMAGLPYRAGKESRAVYGESFSPVKEEKTTFGSTIFFFTRQEDHPVSYKAPDFAYPMEYVEELLGKGGRIVNERMDGCDYWWFETGGTQDTIADAQEIGLELKRFVAGVWNYIKNSGKYRADCLTLAWEGNLPGKRESRRMTTKKVLTQQDVLERPFFPDAAFFGGWYLDFHPSDGFLTEEDNCTQIPVQPYAIPLGCLYHPDVSNLLFAGRDIGVSHVAFASTRIMNTCALSGQAAGTLAAKCRIEESSPAGLTGEDTIWIQEQLLDDDMMIPGVSRHPGRSLAEEAAITVSSREETGTAEPQGWFDVESGSVLILPWEEKAAKFLIRVKEKTTLSYTVSCFDLPSKLASGTVAGSGCVDLETGESWVELPMTYGERCQFIRLDLRENPLIQFALADSQLTGFLLGRKDNPGYEYPCILLQNGEKKALYGGENLVNGWNRPWQGPNSWISSTDDKEPWIRLSFTGPKIVRRVLVYFNPDLSKELGSSRAGAWDDHHKFQPRLSMPPELVREAVLTGVPAEEEEKPAPAEAVLAVLKDNWRRRWDIRLDPPVEVTELKLAILATYGAKRAEVFEIRVY